MKIRKGDKIKVLAGKDAGKTGKVLKVFPEKLKLIVEDINLIIKHTRPKRQGEKGQKIQFPSPLSVAKVALVCPKCHQATRVSFKLLENQKKLRACHKCKETF